MRPSGTRITLNLARRPASRFDLCPISGGKRGREIHGQPAPRRDRRHLRLLLHHGERKKDQLVSAAFGQISGGHFNPAVTFGLAVARKFPTAAVVPYWVAQLIGGFIAVLVAALIYTNDIKDSLVKNPGAGVAYRPGSF